MEPSVPLRTIWSPGGVATEPGSPFDWDVNTLVAELGTEAKRQPSL